MTVGGVTVGKLIDVLGGKLVHGEAGKSLAGVNSAHNAGPADLVFAEDAEAAKQSLASAAGAVVLKPRFLESSSEAAPVAVIEAEQPRLWFARAAKLLAKVPPPAGIHSTAVLGEGVVLGPEVTVGPCAVIGDRATIGAGTRIEAGAAIGEGVRIGERCRIYPRVVVYPGTTVGNRVILHAGVVLGADGFGYVRDPETGEYTQFPQRGVLVLEDDVEIGANSTIDRGALAETRIARGSKLDNLVHIGHNVRIGRQVVMAAQTGISGSCRIGDRAVFGGQVGIGDHAEVGEGVILGGQGGVLPMKKLRGDGVAFWGTPAKPLRRYLQELAAITRAARESRRRGSGQIQRRDPQPDPQLDQPEAPNGGEDNGGRDKDA